MKYLLTSLIAIGAFMIMDLAYDCTESNVLFSLLGGFLFMIAGQIIVRD